MLIVFSCMPFAGSHLSQDRAPDGRPLYIYNNYTHNAYNGQPYPSSGVYLITSEGIVATDTLVFQSGFKPRLDRVMKKANNYLLEYGDQPKK